MIKKILLTLAFYFSIIYTGCAEIHTYTIDGDHGKLAAILQQPDTRSPHPLVILMHGFRSDKNTPLFRDIANKLEEIGIASLRFDFNGCGESEGRFQDMTIVNEIIDAQKIYQFVRTLPDITSVSLLGHSQGGVVAGMLAGQLGTEKVKSVVLLAPASVIRDNALSGNFFGYIYDTKNVPEYLELFNGTVIGRAFIETAKTLPIYETSRQFTGPVLIIHGLDDDIVPPSYGEQYHDIYTDSELRLLPGTNHSFLPNPFITVDLVTEFFKQKLLNQ